MPALRRTHWGRWAKLPPSRLGVAQLLPLKLYRQSALSLPIVKQSSWLWHG